MAECTLMIPSLISWTASPLPSTPMTLMPSWPSSPTTSSSSPPRHRPTAPATKAGTRCARSGESCWRRRPRPGLPSRSSSPAARDAPSCAGATTGRTGTCVAWMLSGSEMASSPKAWPTSRARAIPGGTRDPARGPGGEDLGERSGEPPVPPAEQRDRRRDQERAHHGGVQQDACAERGGEHLDVGVRRGSQGGEGEEQDQRGAGDQPAGAAQPFGDRVAGGAGAVILLPHPGQDEHLIVHG